MSSETLLYAMALQHVSQVGDIIAKKLISHCGTPEAIFKEKPSNLLKIDGIGRIVTSQLKIKDNLKAAEAELNYMYKRRIKGLYFLDANYPEYLKHCIDGPLVLFVAGSSNLESKRPIALVGTRKVTPHGIAFCKSFVEGLAFQNPTVVSGLAFGVDIVAHKSAIENKLETIACLGHGLDHIYPKEHSRYIDDIMNNGALVTEFWSKTKITSKNFVRRNRIIAGLSQATVVIESGIQGGSLITADMALGYNRDVFAVPGRPSDVRSSGCNRLIISQKAQMICSAVDLIYWMGWGQDENAKSIQKSLFLDLTVSEQQVFNYLQESGKEHLDQMALNCQMTTHETASVLLQLELKGAVRSLPGKIFEAI